MRHYVSNIDMSNVSLGLNAGDALTTGTNNVLLGSNAGAALTTGSTRLTFCVEK